MSDTYTFLEFTLHVPTVEVENHWGHRTKLPLVTNLFLSNSNLSCFSFTWVFPLAQLIVSACTVEISWWVLVIYTYLIQDCVAKDALFVLFLSMSSSSGEMNFMCFFPSFFLGSSKGTTWSLQAQSFVAG